MHRGLAAAIRVLPRDIIPVENVGFPSDAVWQDIANLRQGLVIITGITGSGKSTTIASLIQRINETRRTHIITLEDPVEYHFDNRLSVVSQCAGLYAKTQADLLQKRDAARRRRRQNDLGNGHEAAFNRQRAAVSRRSRSGFEADGRALIADAF